MQDTRPNRYDKDPKYTRKFPEPPALPAFSWVNVRVEFYHACRRDINCAVVLSRIYDRVSENYEALRYKGRKDLLHPTDNELRIERNKKILESSAGWDLAQAGGWVLFKSDYWVPKLAMQEGQLRDSLRRLAAMGAVELGMSEPKGNNLCGIRIVRLADTFPALIRGCFVEEAVKSGGRIVTDHDGNPRTRIYASDFLTFAATQTAIRIPDEGKLPGGLVPDPIAEVRKKFPSRDPSNKKKKTGETITGASDVIVTGGETGVPDKGNEETGVFIGGDTENRDSSVSADCDCHSPDCDCHSRPDGDCHSTKNKDRVGIRSGGIRTEEEGWKNTLFAEVPSQDIPNLEAFQATEALTRLSQATAINTQQEKTSFDFPGNSAQQLKPSATKEIEEAPATEPNDSRKEEVRAEPSRRITVQDAAAGLKELCEVEEGPWAVPSDYALQSVVSRVLRLGWTYAVRHMVFNRDLRGFETPLDTWPILGEESLPSPAQIHALVQAAIDANNGDDPWPTVNGHQDTHGFPTFSDTRFNRAYHHCLEELENAV